MPAKKGHHLNASFLGIYSCRIVRCCLKESTVKKKQELSTEEYNPMYSSKYLDFISVVC